MNRCIALLGAALLAPASLLAFDQAEAARQAEQATAAFGGALKTELVAAMQSGGALAAIEVCHAEAGGIAARISNETGMKLSRVSLKNRNPENAANDWQRQVLESFEERKASGEMPGALIWQETSETDVGLEFRYMKAIPTGGVCLQCHGTAIAPDVAAKLSELYPGDKATGYETGDIRGAFLVIRSMD